MITYLLNLFKNQPLLPEHMHEPAKSGSDMSAAGKSAERQDLIRQSSRNYQNYEGNIEANGHDFSGWKRCGPKA